MYCPHQLKVEINSAAGQQIQMIQYSTTDNNVISWVFFWEEYQFDEHDLSILLMQMYHVT